MAFILETALLLLACFLPLSAAEKTPISVRDFGAKGDGVTDDTSAINAAIQAAKKQGPDAVVVLPSGRYKTALGKEKSILINGADGLTFQGEGETTLVSGDLDAPFFRIADSQRVTVRNIAIDHDPLGYTQGTIVSVDLPGMTCEVAIDPGYPRRMDRRSRARNSTLSSIRRRTITSSIATGPIRPRW